MTAIPATANTVANTSRVFRDRLGGDHTLVSGHRDRLKPGWRRMLLADPPPPSDAELADELDGYCERLKLAERVLATYNGGFENRNVLTIGCGDIVEPMLLAGWGGQRVVGMDREFRDSPEQAERLTELVRNRLRDESRPIPQGESVSLREDDICDSELPDASFDLVCSWRTLEHVAEPHAAFGEMFRLLKPGGLMYHEYNPFFGLDGGHSLVTLDIPWGHVRFDRTDIASYLAEHRLAEQERALAYYDNCLNRMTLADVERFAREAGFEMLAFIPRTRTEDLLAVDADLMCAAKRNYPNITINDLICRIVRMVLRRPE